MLLSIIKSEELQKVLLPTYKRQLMLIHQNGTNYVQSDIGIKRHHHPILMLEETAQGRITQMVVCKDAQDTLQLNTFSNEKGKWFRPIKTGRLFLEKYVIPDKINIA